MKKFRKAIAVLLAVLLCINAIPGAVWAETAQTTEEQVTEDALKTEQREEEKLENKTVEDTEEPKNDYDLKDVNLEENEDAPDEVPNVTEEQRERSAILKNAASFAGGNGSVENPYQIATAEQLDAVRNDLSASYVLINDIDLSGFENWKPIGKDNWFTDNNRSAAFSGRFDGQGHQVLNLKINFDATFQVDLTGKVGSATIGLFGMAKENSLIKNINIKNGLLNANVSDSKDNFYDIAAGGICGNSLGVIQNCTFDGKISIIDGDYSDASVGGIVGVSKNLKEKSIEGCNNFGTINVKSINKAYCGGIVGMLSSGVVNGKNVLGGGISNCVNKGEVTGEIISTTGSNNKSPFSLSGGIVGSAGANIDSCYNSGNITAIAYGLDSETTTFGCSARGIGGFEGLLSMEKPKISNCQNSAKEINAKRRIDGGVLIFSEESAGRISGKSRIEDIDLTNNLSWTKTQINGNEISGDDPNAGPNKKHGKSVEASELDESIRPSDPDAPVVKEPFQMERDNFKFSNAQKHYTKNYWTKYIDKIKNRMDNGVNKIIEDKMNEKWSGSCYGMCAVAALNKYRNRLNFSNYQKDAQVPYDLNDPNKNEEVLSLINYYYLTQFLPDHDALEENQDKRFQEDQTYFAQKIVEAAKKAENSGIPSILEYRWWERNNKILNIEQLNEQSKKDPENIKNHAHAVLICGLEMNDNNSLYKVKIYDPNEKNKTQSLTVSLNYRAINYHTTDGLFPRTFKFNINAGDSNKDTNNKNTDFMPYCITSGLDQVDLINIEGRDCNITRTKKDQATLTVPQNKAFSLTTSDGTTYKMGEEGPLSFLNSKVDSDTEEEKSNISFVLDNIDSYTFMPETKEDLSVAFTLGDAYMEVVSDKIDSSVFDPKGEIVLRGSGSKYNLELTLNKSLQFLPWYTVGAQGDNSNNVSLERVENGVLLSADQLENTVITADNDKENKKLTVNVANNKVLITEHDSNLAVYSDEDNDGNYETLVAETDTMSISNIILDQEKIQVGVGESVKLTPTITPDNATEKAVTWSSSDNNIATVDENGLVTAVAEGKATITVTTQDGDKTATCEVTVTKKEDSGKPGEPSNPAAPTVKPNEGQGTTAAGQLKPDTTNNGINPLTGMTLQEKMNTMAIWLAAAALCAVAIFMVKRRTEK